MLLDNAYSNNYIDKNVKIRINKCMFPTIGKV